MLACELYEGHMDAARAVAEQAGFVDVHIVDRRSDGKNSSAYWWRNARKDILYGSGKPEGTLDEAHGG
ncbi:MAG: hypothetical protein ACLTDR_06770 [Adlercreutzia equolifaciens]